MTAAARIALAGALILTAVPTPAQQPRQNPPARPAPAAPAAPQTPAPPPTPEPPPAAYEPLLIRLGETLGALAFLTDLCRDAGAAAPPPGEAWRQRMRELIEAEAVAAGQKERFAGAFNRGYSGYATTYRSCTPAGRAAIELLLKDGTRLARELSERYGL